MRISAHILDIAYHEACCLVENISINDNIIPQPVLTADEELGYAVILVCDVNNKPVMLSDKEQCTRILYGKVKLHFRNEADRAKLLEIKKVKH